MTDEPFNKSDQVSAHFADRIMRAQEVAAGARKQAISAGVHEHIADSIYAGVFQATAMKLHDAECKHCGSKLTHHRDKNRLVVPVIYGLLAAVHPFIAAHYVSDKRWGYAGFYALVGLGWAWMSGQLLARWWWRS